MIDFFNLSDNNLDSQVFYTKGTDFQIWQKPSYAKMVCILCIGGGSGGGAFAASNLTELMKSRLIVEKVLLNPIYINGKT